MISGERQTAINGTALILGASRGLGLALVEEWCRRGGRVVATVRTPAAALAAVASRYDGYVRIETVDMDDAATIGALRDRFAGQPIDVIVANAGIALATSSTAATVDETDFLAMMRTNALAPVRALELLQDLVPADGVLSVMSSELGSIARNTGFWSLYSCSKAALNMLMKGFAASRSDDPRAMLLLAPGWVKTDMGGKDALFAIDQSIPLVVDVIEANRGKPGLRFVDRFGNNLPW